MSATARSITASSPAAAIAAASVDEDAVSAAREAPAQTLTQTNPVSIESTRLRRRQSVLRSDDASPDGPRSMRSKTSTPPRRMLDGRCPSLSFGRACRQLRSTAGGSRSATCARPGRLAAASTRGRRRARRSPRGTEIAGLGSAPHGDRVPSHEHTRPGHAGCASVSVSRARRPSRSPSETGPPVRERTPRTQDEWLRRRAHG